MSVYLKKIKRIISTFNEEEQDELTKYYFERSKSLLLDDKLVSKAKIHLLRDLKNISSNISSNSNTFSNDIKELENELMNHKVLQTRALILDLITMDYSKDTEAIYKPEKWIKEIVKDIQDTFLGKNIMDSDNNNDINNDNSNSDINSDINSDNNSNYNIYLLSLYNSKLINEFRSIFITNEKYGTGGNQLLLNFKFYSGFMKKIVDFDFEEFLKEIENQM